VRDAPNSPATRGGVKADVAAPRIALVMDLVVTG
jgi:hypothetical protein